MKRKLGYLATVALFGLIGSAFGVWLEHITMVRVAPFAKTTANVQHANDILSELDCVDYWAPLP